MIAAGTMRAAAVVGFVGDHGAGLCRHVAAMFYASPRSAQRDLTRFIHMGFLQREPLPSIRQGRKEFVYWRGRKPRDLPHRLAIVDTAVAFTVHGRELGITAQTTTHERFEGFIPDLAVILERDGKRMLGFGEVDLATEPVRILADKAERYLGLLAANGHHALTSIDASAFRSFKVCIATTSARRVESIVRALPVEPPRVFFVSTLEAVQADPYRPIWRVPGTDGLHALVRDRGAKPGADAVANPVAGNATPSVPIRQDSGLIVPGEARVVRTVAS